MLGTSLNTANTKLQRGTGFNYDNALAAGSKEIAPSFLGGFQTLNENAPAYNKYLGTQIQNFSTPEGLNSVANENRNQLLGQAGQNGATAANELAYQGLGQNTQDAAMFAAHQNALQNSNTFQTHLNTPEGHQAVTGYLTNLMNQLGVDNPIYKVMQANYAQRLQGKQVQNSTPQSPGFLGSILGAAAPLLGGALGAGGILNKK